ncbi:nuclear transport factor 2 family protein [Novosphingobium gossypii]|uniref:nuclear transport factor 2 family protein n=1 Tax=Novosphingobium gossypii TaxID=1604774 RepID=UPI003D198135
MTLEDLLAREAIRQLRVDYATAFDTMDEAAVRRNFVEDVVCDYPTGFGGTYRGVEAVLALFRQHWQHMRAPLETLHHVANHSIEITSPDTARGHCILLDLVTRQHAGSPIATPGGDANPLLLIGRYDDEYVRVEGAWKFARIRLTTLWPNRSD